MMQGSPTCVARNMRRYRKRKKTLVSYDIIHVPVALSTLAVLRMVFDEDELPEQLSDLIEEEAKKLLEK